jgi:PKD repeat protein
MKKLLLLLSICGLFNLTLLAQEKRCITDEVFIEELAKDPQYGKNLEDLEKFTQLFSGGHFERQRSSLVYVIPCVVHVLHDYGPENISDSTVIASLALWTMDFRKQNPDTDQVITPFRAIVADVEIEFRLANIDPNGNCTNGIEHIRTPLTYLADNSSKLNPWPNNKYLNIWSAHSLANSSAAAYAHYPGGNNAVDGVMCRYNYMDNVQNTLTHEIGHYLNLWHVWGSTNAAGVACGDDGVADTPITKGWNLFCPDSTDAAICNPPIIENYQNYMEYSYCDVMFTEGQKTRMHATLNASVSGRNNLWTPANLLATGTDGSPVNICVPVADFKAQHKAACAGTPVNFSDQSWKGAVTSWNWSFPGGTPSSSTDANPSVIYTNSGVYTVTLVVANSAGSDSITKTSIIRITAAPEHTIPFSETFEDSTSFPGSDGWVENEDGNSTWARVANANTTPGGSNCIRMNNYTNTSGAVDEWITPSMDFSNVDAPYMNFYVANAQRNSSSNDELKIWYSLNCGQTWQGTSYNKSGSQLSTAGIVTSNFTPNQPAQWRAEYVNLNPVKFKPNVRFKFVNTSDHGNNTYIDDINFSGTLTSIDETDALQSGFAMYPNPTDGASTVSFNLSKTSDVIIEIKDILGQTVSTVLKETLSIGIHEQLLPVLSSGIYMVDVVVNNKHHVRKLIVS